MKEANDWQEEWKGMPEYKQTRVDPYKEIIVRFKTKEDYESFAEVIGQNLTDKTKSIWHPKVQKGKVCKFANLLYTDES
jgi:hypothetical protein